MDVDHVEESEKAWTKLEFDSEEADALSDLGLGALDISFETSRAGDASGRVRVRVHSSSSASSSSHHQQHQLELRTQQNHLSLPTPDRNSEESDEEREERERQEREELGPFLTSTSRSGSAGGQTISEGLNLGFGLNSLNNFGMNDLGMDVVGLGMSSLGMGVGMPFGTPDYGLDSDISSAHTRAAMRRRVRIALARLPHAGSEGGEWDVFEVAA